MATKGYTEDELADYYDEDYEEEEEGDWEQEEKDKEDYSFVDKEKAAKKPTPTPPKLMTSPKGSFVRKLDSASTSSVSLPAAALAATAATAAGYTSNHVAKLAGLCADLALPYQLSTRYMERALKCPDPMLSAREGLANPNFPKEAPSKPHEPQTVFVVIGHVDAGKSTLMAQLVKEFSASPHASPVHEPRKGGKTRANASALAWEMDVGSDEREHGVTIDSKSKLLLIDNRPFVAIDAPGHSDYVPSMLLGAMQADAAVLVIDCVKFDAGFSRGGQTKEHVALIRSLGIGQLVIVLNKVDMLDPADRVEDLETIKCQLRDFVFEEMRFAKNSVKFVDVSAIQGLNILNRADDERGCLREALIGLHPRDHGPIHHTVCVPIVDVAGDRLSGRIECGSVHTGEKLMILPSRHIVVVGTCPTPYLPGDYLESLPFTLHDASGSSSPTSAANVIHPGSVLVDPLFPSAHIGAVTTFFARILVINDDFMPVVKGQSVTVNCHTAMIDGFISRLVVKVPAPGAEQRPGVPKCLVKGDVGIVEVTVRKLLVVEPDAVSRVTGRVVIRDRGVTIAAGLVVSSPPPV